MLWSNLPINSYIINFETIIFNNFTFFNFTTCNKFLYILFRMHFKFYYMCIRIFLLLCTLMCNFYFNKDIFVRILLIIPQ